tara:strand:- start:635 stop:1792 length:1158 start_codon:yes stop_codon:yes gene_type:complete
MGKGSSSTPVQSAGLPEWSKEAHMGLVGKASDFAFDPQYRYQPYEGQRIAGKTPYQKAAGVAIGDMFERGDPYGDYASSQLFAAGDIPGSFYDLEPQYTAKNYDVSNYAGPRYEARQYDFGQFTDPGLAQSYMNPFYQNVVNPQLARATEEFNRQQNRSAAERVASGAMGGYREALGRAMAGSEHQRNLANIQGKGSFSAYESAQQQFQRDRAASIQASEMAEKSRLAASQQGIDVFGRDRDAGIQAAKLGEESAWRAAQERQRVAMENQNRLFKEADLRRQLATQARALGTEGQQRALQRISMMQEIGAQDQALEQAGLSMAEEEAYRVQMDPMRRMEWYGALLGGNPSQYTYAQPTQPGGSVLSSLLGTGLGSMNLAELLGDQ